MIYIIKQEGLYQNKVNSRLVSIDNCEVAFLFLEYEFFECWKWKHSPSTNVAQFQIQGPVPEMSISVNPGLKVVLFLYFKFLYIA